MDKKDGCGTDDTVSNQTRNTNKRSRGWCFTLNNYTKADIKAFKMLSERYCFQEETGKSGTRHLQGVIYFPNAISFKSAQSKCVRAHWEPCKNLMASVRYCSKEDTRTGSCYSNGFDTHSTVKKKKFEIDIPKLTRQICKNWVCVKDCYCDFCRDIILITPP